MVVVRPAGPVAIAIDWELASPARVADWSTIPRRTAR
jgi:hypothetical protein